MSSSGPCPHGKTPNGRVTYIRSSPIGVASDTSPSAPEADTCSSTAACARARIDSCEFPGNTPAWRARSIAVVVITARVVSGGDSGRSSTVGHSPDDCCSTASPSRSAASRCRSSAASRASPGTHASVSTRPIAAHPFPRAQSCPFLPQCSSKPCTNNPLRSSCRSRAYASSVVVASCAYVSSPVTCARRARNGGPPSIESTQI